MQHLERLLFSQVNADVDYFIAQKKVEEIIPINLLFVLIQIVNRVLNGFEH